MLKRKTAEIRVIHLNMIDLRVFNHYDCEMGACGSLGSLRDQLDLLINSCPHGYGVHRFLRNDAYPRFWTYGRETRS